MASLEQHTSVLGKKNGRHLLRRVTFKYTKELIADFANKTPQQALDLLFQDKPLHAKYPYYPQADSYFWTVDTTRSFPSQSGKNNYVAGWWWYNAQKDDTLKHKMSDFLATRFTMAKNEAGQPNSSTFFYDYLQLLLHHSYGNYKSLAKKMSIDNAMLQYLNNNENVKATPNENYAREFLELFTIGKGEQVGEGDYTTYTEHDIVEFAKILTGFKDITWNFRADPKYIDPETNIPKGKSVFQDHNTDVKRFSSAFSFATISPAADEASMENELSEFVELVFSKIETAENIVRKMYIYFVKSAITPEIEKDIIKPLALDLKNGNYEMKPVLRKLLESKHFYDLDDNNSTDEIIGGIIKSPLQLSTEMTSYFGSIPDITEKPDVLYPDSTTEGMNSGKARFYYRFFYEIFLHGSYMKASNMVAFEPSNVAGHLAYYQHPSYDKNWVSSATMIARYRLGESLLKNLDLTSGASSAPRFTINIVNFVKDNISNPRDPFAITSELCNDLFGQEPDEDRINYFMNNFLLDNLSVRNWEVEWDNYINKKNNDAAVKSRLIALVSKILGAPEFQLF